MELEDIEIIGENTIDFLSNKYQEFKKRNKIEKPFYKTKEAKNSCI